MTLIDYSIENCFSLVMGCDPNKLFYSRNPRVIGCFLDFLWLIHIIYPFPCFSSCPASLLSHNLVFIEWQGKIISCAPEEKQIGGMKTNRIRFKLILVKLCWRSHGRDQNQYLCFLKFKTNKSNHSRLCLSPYQLLKWIAAQQDGISWRMIPTGYIYTNWNKEMHGDNWCYIAGAMKLFRISRF